MSRFEDSPGLFGGGFGISARGPVTCEWCGVTHNKDNEDLDEDQSVAITEFADKQICDCCFEKIEGEIIHRMKYILKWFRRIQEERTRQVNETEVLLLDVEGGDAVILGPIIGVKM